MRTRTQIQTGCLSDGYVKHRRCKNFTTAILIHFLQGIWPIIAYQKEEQPGSLRFMGFTKSWGASSKSIGQRNSAIHFKDLKGYRQVLPSG